MRISNINVKSSNLNFKAKLSMQKSLIQEVNKYATDADKSEKLRNNLKTILTVLPEAKAEITKEKDKPVVKVTLDMSRYGISDTPVLKQIVGTRGKNSLGAAVYNVISELATGLTCYNKMQDK